MELASFKIRVHLNQSLSKIDMLGLGTEKRVAAERIKELKGVSTICVYADSENFLSKRATEPPDLPVQ